MGSEEAAHEGEVAGGLPAMLADDWTWLTLRELPGPAAEPERQERLQKRLPPLAVSTVNERLHRLLAAGIASERRISARPPLVAYQLTRQGAQARPIRDVAARWEARVAPAAAARLRQPGGVALGLLADRWVLPILCCLAGGPRWRTEIARRLPGLAQATLDDRLRRLRELGLVRCERHRGFPVQVECELTPGGRSLPAVALPAVRWEWRWGRPARPLQASDLAGLLRLVVPLARSDAGVDGACEFAALSAAAVESSATLGVEDGAIAFLSSSRRTAAVDARAEGRPLEWCDALIRGRTRDLRVSGSAELARKAIEALHRALAVDWSSPRR